jgi:hypothetical protein
VYHGTRRAFDKFAVLKPIAAPGNPAGVYFTPSRCIAEEYAMDDDGALDESSRIIAAHVRLPSDADGQVVERANGDREVVVFRPAQIQILPAQSLRFDPAARQWSPDRSLRPVESPAP